MPEQFPKQPEQFRLDFGVEKTPENKTEEAPALETPSYDELKALYQEKVRVNPENYKLNRGELILGIQDPEKERARIALEEMKEDQKERASGRAGR
jgi:hypothetical protein